jgi:RNA polymerase sigma factor, sigma-70 family
LSLSLNEQFTQIYDSHYSMVYRYFFYKSGNKELSEDLTAETFIKAYTNLMRFDQQKATIQTWLMTIAGHIYIDNYRKYKNQIYASYELLAELPNTNSVVEKTIFTADTYEILYKAISGLNEKERNLIALKYSSEFKNKDIALLIGKSERHTAVLLGRALKKLKQILIKMGVDDYE